MPRLLGYFTLSALLAKALPAMEYRPHCSLCLTQNIFDEDAAADDGATDNGEAPEPAVSKDSEKSNSTDKPKKKKKSRKKKKKLTPESAPGGSESQTLSPQELARQSYVWAPEPFVRLKSTAPGMKTTETTIPAKAAVPKTDEMPQPTVQRHGFRLPQIPITQVLIVAGFVILFLIYRFRVTRQMKRRKY